MKVCIRGYAREFVREGASSECKGVGLAVQVYDMRVSGLLAKRMGWAPWFHPTEQLFTASGLGDSCTAKGYDPLPTWKRKCNRSYGSFNPSWVRSGTLQ